MFCVTPPFSLAPFSFHISPLSRLFPVLSFLPLLPLYSFSFVSIFPLVSFPCFLKSRTLSMHVCSFPFSLLRISPFVLFIQFNQPILSFLPVSPFSSPALLPSSRLSFPRFKVLVSKGKFLCLTSSSISCFFFRPLSFLPFSPLPFFSRVFYIITFLFPSFVIFSCFNPYVCLVCSSTMLLSSLSVF